MTRLLIFSLLAVLTMNSYTAENGHQEVTLDISDYPEVVEFPDPFLLQNGKRILKPAEWPKRRAEMLALIQQYEYGHIPPAPGNVAVAGTPEQVLVNDDKTMLHRVTLKFGPDQALSLKVQIYIPHGIDGKRPVVVRVGLGDEAVPAMTARGYIFACYEHENLDPDTEGYDEVGPAQAAYPDYDWASLGVWSWGASRVLDYLLTLPEVDPEKTVVTGHSRCGKTALLAGAMDERFKIVVPNGSGCGGAAAFRVQGEKSEDLALITDPKRFKSWFHKDFEAFAAQEAKLPFDQHFMRALVAPRVVLNTDGDTNLWANLLGTQAAWQAAQPVFDFLGVPENNFYHMRPGHHDQLPEDFAALLDCADKVFFGKDSGRVFNTPMFPEFSPDMPWIVK